MCVQHEPWTRQGSYSSDLLAAVRQGEHPMVAYGTADLAKPLARSLSRILINFHTLFGSYRLFNPGRWVAPHIHKVSEIFCNAQDILGIRSALCLYRHFIRVQISSLEHLTDVCLCKDVYLLVHQM